MQRGVLLSFSFRIIKEVIMSASPMPMLRLTNATIAILVVCSLGALVEGTGCNDVRMPSCRMFTDFFSHVPFYILGAVGVSEAISWGLFRKLTRLNN
ncbi:hypothetical protein HP546_00615 [Pseudomonas sp. CM25]|uniref:hypothetical protein n=1 Tax=Pseudomonas sp. CM25 TaxID=2738448 RepID=UPI001553E538|nr:hypothetical protein [Pseudomonas sp. CM25]NQD53867.1 hypothetical protein [Pseudomonas sp. CM25]